MAGRPDTVDLSIIAPCYNEEENLPELVERTERVLERRRIRGELVLVNDGSRDGTGAQIEVLRARHPCVVGVHHPTNRGIPASWRSGFGASRGRWVCTIDADLQYQPEAIALLHREMSFSGADLVQGWRSTLERQHDHRYYWSRGLDYLLKVAFAMPEYDVKSGFVLYRREVFEDILREAGRFHYFQHMITVVAKAKGYSIRQVETLFAERYAGTSFIGGFPLKMMGRTLVDIGRAFVAYRLREPKDPSLESTLPAGSASATRTAAVWLHDAAISGNAPRYLDELRRTQWLPRAELEKLQVRRLRRLVATAADRVGYWRELFQATGLALDQVQNLDDLRRVPILEKSALADNIYFDLLADGCDKRKIAKLATSGNSGEPLGFFVDRLQRDMRWANAVRHREWAGWRPGAPIVRIRPRPVPAPTSGRLVERLRAALADRHVLATDVVDADVGARIHAMRAADGFLEADAEVLRVLASLDAFAPGGRPVISTGQTLDPSLRRLLENRIGARVFDRFGAREFGPIAQGCEAGSWHVNAESFIVEVVKDGRPAAEGETGDLLVTDLTNHCVPLLRYRLGDVAIATARPCDCGRGLPVLGSVVGRPDGVVVAGARRVPSAFFADLFAQYEYAVRRWQVAQTAPDVLAVRIVRKSRFGAATDATLRRALADALGAGVALTLSFVEEIPRDDPRPFVPLVPASDKQAADAAHDDAPADAAG